MKKLFNALFSCLTVFYTILVLTYLLYTLRISEWGISTILIIIPALFFYPFLLTLIPAALGSIAIFATRKLSCKSASIITGAVLWPVNTVIHCTLLMDTGLYFRYGYHINPHVINIFTTPGGFEGRGMRPNEIIMLGVGLLLLFAAHAAVISCFIRFEKWHFLKISSWKFPAFIIPVYALLFAVEFFTYAYAHFILYLFNIIFKII